MTTTRPCAYARRIDLRHITFVRSGASQGEYTLVDQDLLSRWPVQSRCTSRAAFSRVQPRSCQHEPTSCASPVPDCAGATWLPEVALGACATWLLEDRHRLAIIVLYDLERPVIRTWSATARGHPCACAGLIGGRCSPGVPAEQLSPVCNHARVNTSQPTVPPPVPDCAGATWLPEVALGACATWLLEDRHRLAIIVLYDLERPVIRTWSATARGHPCACAGLIGGYIRKSPVHPNHF
ncbi:hypothetical protein MRX96_039315 [Rhipicephalus microplus]